MVTKNVFSLRRIFFLKMFIHLLRFILTASYKTVKIAIKCFVLILVFFLFMIRM
jgi:hypothetical protein